MTIGLAMAVIWLGAAAGMSGIWLLAMRSRKIGYVDAAWAGLMTLAALFAGAFGEGSPLVRSLVAMFGSIWGARLCLHLLKRTLNEDEDGRYLALRAAWQDSPVRFFAFFQVQAMIVALLSLPLLAAAANPNEHVTVWTVLAGLVWITSMIGETLADRQLGRFRADPVNRGRTCRRGLWAWSRHPNYFFEWLHWFSYVLLSIGSSGIWLSLVGPVLMLVFLHVISGIPWSEAQSLRTRGEDYRRYQREVSAFFPRPPRHG